MPAKGPCGICSKRVTVSHKAIFCDICSFWIHKKCNNTSDAKYEEVKSNDKKWFCQKCFNMTVPFNDLSHEDLKLTIQGKNIEFFLEPDTNNCIQFFKDIDTSLIPDDIAQINCPYLSLSEVNKAHKNGDYISTLHLNIASLDLHFDELNVLLKNCDIPFSFIGITETGFKDEFKAKNTAMLPNYKHFDCCTQSSKGGARIYVSEEFDTLPRSDLCIYKTNEIESVVREVVYDNNFIVACIYKHPNADADHK